MLVVHRCLHEVFLQQKGQVLHEIERHACVYAGDTAADTSLIQDVRLKNALLYSTHLTGQLLHTDLRFIP